MATKYQRLDYRDSSAMILLRGIESGIRANWRAMQQERRNKKVTTNSEWSRNHHAKWALIHKAVLCELLDIRRQAR